MTDEIERVIAGLTEAQRRALPKAQMLRVRWLGWRYAGIYRNRGANFCRQVIGPVVIYWRMPWLPHSARALYPQLFKDR